jgi:hypothetical protein
MFSCFIRLYLFPFNFKVILHLVLGGKKKGGGGTSDVAVRFLSDLNLVFKFLNLKIWPLNFAQILNI